MNSQLISYLIISIFIFSCSENETQVISNTLSDLPEPNYKINLWSSNSGSTLESVTIYWGSTEGEVKLFDSGVLINSNGNSHTFSGLNPGEFRDITIQVIRVDSTYVDSIQIFTRPVYPVSNFWYEVETVMRGNGIWDEGESYTDLGNGIWDEGESYTDLGDGEWNEGEYFTDANANGIWDEGESYTDLGNGEWNEGEPYTDLSNGEWNEGEVFIDIKKPEYHRVLNWSTTAELDDNFTNYILYRVANNDADDLINSENCGCEIATLTKANTSFIDSTDLMVLDEGGTYAYFYQIRVISGSDGRNSYIYNYTDFTSLSKVSLVDANVSKNNSDFIQVTWEPVSNSTYFYQYEIWRASEENSDNLQRMAIIINPDQGKFMDRAVGTGTTWYYSVAVVDINGNRKFSDFIS